MEYRLKIADETYTVSVDGNADEFKLAVGDDESVVASRVISDHHLHLDIDGGAVNAFVCDAEKGKLIHIDGMTYSVQDVDLLEQGGARKRGGEDLPDVITPKMPSVVVSVLVDQGDEVQKGQGVVVLSAMKMETTLIAPYDGKVAKVNAGEGDKVMPGDILVEIEPMENAVSEAV